MVSNAKTVQEYIDQLPPERKNAIITLRETIASNLPTGFEEQISYGMIGYVVPHSLYPEGYHCTPQLPLPFLNLASQKNFIALYHMGLYAVPEIHDWFVGEYPKHVPTKLDMGKSCIRFKNMQHIPYRLIGALCAKLTPAQWIEVYEKKYKKG